jgi:acyl-CoA hydrolase
MASPHLPTRLDSVERCVDEILVRVGKHIKLGLPVGIGKPNVLINALTQRAIADQTIRLTIFTALSLRRPRGRSAMEKRFLEPFAQRVFGDYPELDYATLLTQNKLPSNIEVCEFFLEPGAWLSNGHLQQHYLSANYTHVVRDLCQRGLNVVAQLIAPSPTGRETYSLSSNPDLTVDLLPYFREQRAQGKPCLLIGQVHRELPYMYGDAVLAANEFDIVLDDDKPDFTLFCPPNMPIGTADYAIALNVSALVKDGGTLQLGIGELGDAIVYGLKLRHEQPIAYREILQSSGLLARHASLIDNIGGTGVLERGLYGCSEMLVDGFIDLYRAGVLKRRVYSHALLQLLLDEGKIGEDVNAATLQALRDAGLEVLTRKDFEQLQTAGVIRDDAHYEPAIDNLVPLLGMRLRNGVLAHGGFFFGPKAFYAALRELPEHERRQFEMQRISFINELYGEDQAVKIAQRRHARFVNTTMMVTGLGAAVSDGLANGSVVSGVGGQYNFVAMAHALPDARSLLCVRSTRTSKGEVSSNIVWNYGHITIPRHLRDIVVTEYGVADLRSKTDAEVVMALIDVMDARFQASFAAEAQRNGKLSADFLIPAHARANTPERLEKLFKPWRQRGFFGDLPFGGDFTDEELVLAKALKQLQADTATTGGRIETMLRALFSAAPDATMQPYLQRMQLERPATISERLEQRALVRALRKTMHQ